MAKKKVDDSYNRYIRPNMMWRKFAWEYGVTIYATCIGGNNVRLYKQKGENFIALSNKQYDQTSQKDVIEYNAEIDRAYEKFYNMKMKKINDKKKRSV